MTALVIGARRGDSRPPSIRVALIPSRGRDRHVDQEMRLLPSAQVLSCANERKHFMRALCVLTLCLAAVPAATQIRGVKTLDIYVIDVDGGEATLLVSPSGESL